MDSLLSIFLRFIAAITALLTYMFVPYMPVMVLVSAAAIALAAGLWWHWTQFSTEYRTSTWQEQLRNYASYAMVLLVILLSYFFYTFAYNGSTLQQYAATAGDNLRNAAGRVSSQVSSGVSRAVSSTSSALLSSSESSSSSSSSFFPAAPAAPAPAAANVGRNSRTKTQNFLV